MEFDQNEVEIISRGSEFDVAGLESFISLQKRADRLEEVLNSEDLMPLARQVAEDSYSRTSLQLKEVAHGDELQLLFANLGSTAVKELADIETIKGIDPSANTADVENYISQKLSIAKRFFEEYGAVKEEAIDFAAAVDTRIPASIAPEGSVEDQKDMPQSSSEEIDSQPAKSVQQEVDRPKKPIKLTITDRTYKRAGSRGKTHYFSKVKNSKKEAVGRGTLLYLISKGEEAVSVKEITEALGYGDDRSAKHAVIESLREFGENIIVNNTRVIKHNGKKRSAVRYYVKPEFELIADTASNLDIERKEQVTQKSKTKGDVAQATPESTVEEEITDKDTYLIACYMSSFNNVLKSLNRPTISNDLLKDLRPSDGLGRGGARSSESINDHRNRAISKIEKLLADKSVLLDFIESVDADDPRYRFVEEFLIHYSDQNSRRLLTLIVTELREDRELKLVSKGRSGILVESGDVKLVDLRGNEVDLASYRLDKPIHLAERRQEKRRDEGAVLEILDKNQDKEVMPLSTSEEKPGEKVEPPEEVAGRGASPIFRKRERRSKTEKMEQVESIIGEMITEFTSHFDANSAHTARQIKGTIRGFISAYGERRGQRQKGRHKDTEAKINLEEYLLIMLEKNSITSSMLGKKSYRKEIEKMVSKMAEAAKATAARSS